LGLGEIHAAGDNEPSIGRTTGRSPASPWQELFALAHRVLIIPSRPGNSPALLGAHQRGIIAACTEYGTVGTGQAMTEP
jgi:hypothetical protein